MDGHGLRPDTYFQGWTPSSHFFGQSSLAAFTVVMILGKNNNIRATRC